MPTNITHTNIYKGEESKEYLLQSITGGETASINGITFKENVKYQWRQRKFTTGDLLVSGGTGAYNFTAGSSVVISATVFEPKKWKVNLEFPFNDFYDMPDSADMGAGQHNEGVPSYFDGALQERISRKTSQEIELGIYNGSVTFGLQGIIPHAVANGVINFTGTTTINASNVVAEFYKMMNLMPAGVKKAGVQKLVIAVPYSVAEFYRQSLSTQGFNTSQNDQTLTVHGIEVVPVAGLSGNKMLFFERANLCIATDLKSDWNEVRIVDMRETTLDDKIRYGMKGTLDAKFIEPTEVVYYNG